MTHSTLYLGTDMVLIVEGLKDREGQVIQDATVTLQALTDVAGEVVGGISLPLSLDHTSGGTYEAIIPKEIEVEAGNLYLARVRAVSNNLTTEWVEKLMARARTA